MIDIETKEVREVPFSFDVQDFFECEDESIYIMTETEIYRLSRTILNNIVDKSQLRQHLICIL